MVAAIKFIKRVFGEYGEDKVGQLSAALAYTAVFSIGPLLLVLISVSSLIFGARAAQGQLYAQLAGAVGPDTAGTLQDVVARTNQTGSGPALLLGILGVLLAAAALTTQLQNSLNAIFKIVPNPAGGWKRGLYVKLKNIGITLLGGLAVMASLATSALINGLGNKVNNYVNLPPFGLEALNNLVSLAAFVLILYLLYRVVPDVKIPGRIVLAASLVAALLFLAGKIFLAIVIGRNGTAGAYGAAASLVTLLLWVYYSAQILFIGAEGMKVYAFDRGFKKKSGSSK